jgi:hypothetical protein
MSEHHHYRWLHVHHVLPDTWRHGGQPQRKGRGRNATVDQVMQFSPILGFGKRHGQFILELSSRFVDLEADHERPAGGIPLGDLELGNRP